VKSGGNKELAGIAKLVTGGSSSLFYFYCVFIKQVRWYYQDSKGKDLFSSSPFYPVSVV
jgi:hypothetical protein